MACDPRDLANYVDHVVDQNGSPIDPLPAMLPNIPARLRRDYRSDSEVNVRKSRDEKFVGSACLA